MGNMGPVVFAGIGGAGMGPLAIYMSRCGLRVFGFDDHLSKGTRLLLLRNGIRLVDRDYDLIGVERVVYSTALTDGDPFLIRARDRAIRCERRGDSLAQIAKEKRLIAVVGSHGKTTTTAFLIRLLRTNGFPADYILGGYFADELPPAGAGGNEWLVAEVDESDGTIESFSPEITVFLNLDLDHETFYGSLENLRQTFLRLFRRTSGPIFLTRSEWANFGTADGHGPSDSPVRPRELAEDFLPRLRFFDDPGAMAGHPPMETIDWNAARTVASFLVPNINSDFLPARVLRRQQILCERSDILVMADYAHHPTEVRAFIESHCQPEDVIIFQPHRFSRTARHHGEFLAIFASLKNFILMPTYGAFEVHDPRGTAEYLAAALTQMRGPVDCLAGEYLFRRLEARFGQGRRRFFFIGAGDIMTIAEKFGRKIQKQCFKTAMIDAGLGPIMSQDVSLKNCTTFRIGGACDFLITPENLGQMVRAMRILHDHGLPFFVIGHGSNILVDDDGFPGAAISLSADFWKIFSPRRGHFLCGAGLGLGQLCREFERLSIADFEFLRRIPGTVGGAVKVNAGAEGFSIGDFVQSVICCDGFGKIREVEDIGFVYRGSNLPPNLTILFVKIRPQNGPRRAEDVVEMRKQYDSRRRACQPTRPSAGSVFKNPQNHSAWQLTDRAGLRGVAIGGAQISPLHCNFIVNENDAKSANVLDLIFLIKNRVKDLFDIDLNTEIEYIGPHWKGRL